MGTTSFGLNGDDILHGSASNDELYGGQGDDRYLFDADGFGHDIIHDKDGGKLIIDGDLFAGMASSQGENQYKLNGMDLTVESMDGIQNLKITSASNDSLTIQDWNRGDFGIILDVPEFSTPSLTFDQWSSDNGLFDFGAMNWDGTLNVNQMALDMDVSVGQLLELPQITVDSADIGIDLGIDLSGMAAGIVNGFVQGIIDGIINSLKESIFSTILKGITQMVASIFIPIVGWASAALAYANMVYSVIEIFNSFKDAYDTIDSISKKVNAFEDKVSKNITNINSILEMVDNMDKVFLTDEAPEGDAHVINTGDGDDVIYTTNFVDHIDAGADNDYVVSMGGDDIVKLGEGDNTAETGAGNDTVTAGAGDDVIQAHGGDDHVNAGDKR